MNKKTIIILSICCIFLIAIISRYYSIDRTAIYKGNKLEWKGVTYIETSGNYSEGNTVAKTKEGNWDINEVKEDETHTFIVIRSFLDQYLFVREDYKIPKSGNVTSVFIQHTRINNEDFCRAVEKIIVEDGEKFIIETDNLYSKASEIWLSYENCPVETKNAGFIGFINNNWVYVGPINTWIRNEDGSPKKYAVNCKIINKDHLQIIESHIRIK